MDTLKKHIRNINIDLLINNKNGYKYPYTSLYLQMLNDIKHLIPEKCINEYGIPKTIYKEKNGRVLFHIDNKFDIIITYNYHLRQKYDTVKFTEHIVVGILKYLIKNNDDIWTRN